VKQEQLFWRGFRGGFATKRKCKPAWDIFRLQTLTLGSVAKCDYLSLISFMTSWHHFLCPSTTKDSRVSVANLLVPLWCHYALTAQHTCSYLISVLHGTEGRPQIVVTLPAGVRCMHKEHGHTRRRALELHLECDSLSQHNEGNMWQMQKKTRKPYYPDQVFGSEEIRTVHSMHRWNGELVPYTLYKTNK